MIDLSNLSKLFPMIRTRSEILVEIKSNPSLLAVFDGWLPERQEEFLDICSGVKGHKILYDMYFKYVFDPYECPEIFKEFLGAIMGMKISSFEVLATNSALIDETHSLMVMDILVRLADGTIINVEIQKIGYAFPGQRAACYSSDLLLRQYARIRRKEDDFSYQKMKPVFTIIIMEESTSEFAAYSEYVHKFSQKSDTGLKLSLLQEYYFIPLDIFTKTVQDKPIEQRTPFEAWLTFLTAEDPEMICKLIKAFPIFELVYRRLYDLCRNIERAMDMFSEQLKIMDRNTTKLMIDELKEKVKEQAKALKQKDAALEQKNAALKNQKQESQQMLGQKDRTIEQLQEEIAALRKLVPEQ